MKYEEAQKTIFEKDKEILALTETLEKTVEREQDADKLSFSSRTDTTCCAFISISPLNSSVLELESTFSFRMISSFPAMVLLTDSSSHNNESTVNLNLVCSWSVEI
jgi:hypothetical protein